MSFMGDVAGGSTIVPRRAGGLGTHNLSSSKRKIADTTHRSILGERMLPNTVASARDVHAMPAGIVGGEAYTPTLLQL